MNKRRITLMVIAIAASVVCLGFMGVRAVTSKIYESRSCEWAIIDNIEMRAKINIPKTIDCKCSYDENTDTKHVVLVLDKNGIDPGYNHNNRLTKMSRATNKTTTFPGIASDSKNLYFREGKNLRGSYKIWYDAVLGKMWVTLKYRN